jgi:predicted deacetylase
MKPRRLAVALHDVEPATYDRCALIRDWLNDLGVDRATLLVIPAPDLHAFDRRRPELAAWLEERVQAGDSIAQHGFQHRQTRTAGAPRQLLARLQGGTAAEFPGLDAGETERAGALREVLTATFDWWAGVWTVHDGHGGLRSPALGLGTSGPLRRALSPPLVRAGALVPSRTIRLDLHPADFDHPRNVLALEWVLRRAHRHAPITYDELAHG